MKRDISLIPFTRDLLPLSFKWLHDEEINKLTDAGTITAEGQALWFESLSERYDYKVWGIDANNIHIGVCGLKGINGGTAEYFGYIGEKSYWGGTGTIVMQLIEEEAKKLAIHTISLKVLKCNERAIGLYKKVGYTLISQDDKFYIFNKNLI